MDEKNTPIELEDMKAMWTELNERISALEAENMRLARGVVDNNYKSARERLILRYRRFIILEIFFIIPTSILILTSTEVVEKYRIPTLIYWITFFIIAASEDFFLMCRLEQMDMNRQTVSQIASIAAKNWKFQKLGIMIGLPMAIGAIILFALAMNANIFMILGMVTGGCIGAMIGIRQLLKFMKDYKILQSNC